MSVRVLVVEDEAIVAIDIADQLTEVPTGGRHRSG